MKDKNKILMSIFTTLFVFILLFISAGSIIAKDSERSIKENRLLSQYQSPTKETILSGSWFSAIESYCKDQVIYRDNLLTAYYKFLDYIDLNERLGYVHGDRDFILPVNKYVENPETKAQSYGDKQVEALTILQGAADEYGGTVIYVNIPPKNALYSETYPSFYEKNDLYNTLSREEIIKKAKAANIYTIETYDMLKEHKNEYIYYPTDHHYTCLGAYYVYNKVLNEINNIGGLSLTFPGWDELDIIENNSRMAGSYLQKFGDGNTVKGDHMSYAIPKDMPAYIRYDDGEESSVPLFDETSTDYATFMGGNFANTVIDTNRKELPDICYIGYSFTNVLEMYSVYNFNKVESIDPRYYEGVLVDYIKENKPEYIVVIRDNVYENNSSNKCKVR